MSKKLHSEAFRAAYKAVMDLDASSPAEADMLVGIEAYLAHLAAHGWKLTPRTFTRAMDEAAYGASPYPWTEAYQAAWDAAEWPEDAE